ncbi:hypothetical protein, partial [Rhizobium sp.]|uniref:hypothetical protein n=1 Tax=Rhizobium sp. TaxID=391 RepID=UPI002AA61F42
QGKVEPGFPTISSAPVMKSKSNTTEFTRQRRAPYMVRGAVALYLCCIIFSLESVREKWNRVFPDKL